MNTEKVYRIVRVTFLQRELIFQFLATNSSKLKTDEPHRIPVFFKNYTYFFEDDILNKKIHG